MRKYKEQLLNRLLGPNEIRLPFGKYRGQMLDEVPLSYLDETISTIIPATWFIRTVARFIDDAMKFFELDAIPKESFIDLSRRRCHCGAAHHLIECPDCGRKNVCPGCCEFSNDKFICEYCYEKEQRLMRSRGFDAWCH